MVKIVIQSNPPVETYTGLDGFLVLLGKDVPVQRVEFNLPCDYCPKPQNVITAAAEARYRDGRQPFHFEVTDMAQGCVDCEHVRGSYNKPLSKKG